MTGNWRKILKLIWRDEWAKEGGRKSEWKEQDPALQAVKCVKAQEGINLPKTRTRKLSLQQSFEWISFHLLSLEGKITTSFEMYQVSHKAERNRRWEASLPDLGTALPHSSRDAWVILHSCVTLKTIMLFVVWEKKKTFWIRMKNYVWAWIWEVFEGFCCEGREIISLCSVSLNSNVYWWYSVQHHSKMGKNRKDRRGSKR